MYLAVGFEVKYVSSNGDEVLFDLCLQRAITSHPFTTFLFPKSLIRFRRAPNHVELFRLLQTNMKSILQNLQRSRMKQALSKSMILA